MLFSISQYAYRMLESIENEIEYFFLIFRAAMVLDVCIPSQHFDVECSVFIFTLQTQPPEMFCKKRCIQNFANFTGKYLCWSLFLIKLLA